MFDLGSALRAGFDAVVNLKYSPTDAVELLTRAAAAVRNGKPEPGRPWVRRFEAAVPPLEVPAGAVFDRGRASP